ncbi:hypothetical protein ACA31_07940 [Staphylococcus sp. NAM3COL9]|nr:hypothetical protein ACA31_07940 [Staphylococcus sp. NAM3COL9]
MLKLKLLTSNNNSICAGSFLRILYCFGIKNLHKKDNKTIKLRWPFKKTLVKGAFDYNGVLNLHMPNNT